MKSILFLSLISLSSTACLDQLGDDQVESTDDVPRLAANGMGPADILVTTLNTAPLTGTAISSIAATATGDRFLGYLIECALDGSQSVTASNGKTYAGQFGFATGWTGAALSTADRHWVSACVLARANASRITVNISMRGSHAALAATSTEISQYALQEASFYGDIFDGENQRRGCADVDLLTRPSTGTLPLRQCGIATSSPGTSSCGYAYDGACATHCTTNSNGYTSCTDSSSRVWSEVIKVNLLGN